MQSGRRRFLSHAALALAFSPVARALASQRSTVPRRQAIGFQLYTLGDAGVTDTAHVLAQLARFGYEELEAVTYTGLSPETLRRRADDAGLRLCSVHLDFSAANDPRPLFEIAHRLGVTQVVSSVLEPPGQAHRDADGWTADDVRHVADRANRIGELAQRAGLRYAYHNHDLEFRPLGEGLIGYDILLRETDARYVYFQADCGWMSTAGADPSVYFKRYPGRYLSAHIKDFDGVGLDRAPRGRIVELGRGVIDYRPILAAAREAGVQSLFVEHDPPDGKPITMEAVGREGRYLRTLLDATRA